MQDFSAKKVLVVAARPDDEILGCGATIAKLTEAGHQVFVAILAEGITSRLEASHDISSQETALSDLDKAAQEANHILGVSELTLHNFPDNRMDQLDRLDVIQYVESLLERIQPSVVYTHHAGDVNIDHRRIHEAVVTACRPVPNHSVKQILFFEVASSTEWQTPGSALAFMPNYFVDVSKTLELKLQALKAYDSEMRDWPHSRSVKALEHLARWRGASVGVDAAEAFMLGRYLEV